MALGSPCTCSGEGKALVSLGVHGEGAASAGDAAVGTAWRTSHIQGTSGTKAAQKMELLDFSPKLKHTLIFGRNSNLYLVVLKAINKVTPKECNSSPAQILLSVTASHENQTVQQLFITEVSYLSMEKAQLCVLPPMFSFFCVY